MEHTLGALLDRMTVRVISPDGNITGVLRNRSAVEIEFLNDSYKTLSRSQIEHQLARLLTLLWIGRRKGSREMMRQVSPYEMEPSFTPKHERQVRFREERGNLEIEGTARDNVIRITSTSFQDMAVSVDDQFLDSASEAEFAEEFEAAVADLVADWYDALYLLRQRIYPGDEPKLDWS